MRRRFPYVQIEKAIVLIARTRLKVKKEKNRCDVHQESTNKLILRRNIFIKLQGMIYAYIFVPMNFVRKSVVLSYKYENQ